MDGQLEMIVGGSENWLRDRHYTVGSWDPPVFEDG